MPDDLTPGGTGAPALAAPPVVAAPAAPAPAATPPVAATPPAPAAVADPPAIDPGWLAQRLDRSKVTARNDVLKELGAENLDAAKAAIKAANEAAEAKKTADQRLAELGVKVTAAEQASARQAALLKEQSARMLMVLTAEQQKDVTDFAGDDPEQQLRTIHHFAPLWSREAIAAAAAVPPASGAQPAPGAPPVAPAAPVNTAPPPGAPPGTPPGSPPDHKSVYSATQRTNPFAAAAYGLQHFSAVHTPKT